MNWLTKKPMILKASLLTSIGVAALSVSSFANGWGGDSLGIENRVDKTVILHKVEEGESLYSLLNRYKSSLKLYSKENPDADGHIEIGQVVRIPMEEKYARKLQKMKAKAPATPANDEKEVVAKVPANNDEDGYKPNPPATKPAEKSTPSDTKIANAKPEAKTKPASIASTKHVVEAKQTMFSISKKYGVTVADVQRWNKLTSPNVRVGQVLIINPSETTVAKVTTTPAESTVKQPVMKPEVVKNEPKKSDSTKIAKDIKKTTPPTTPTTKSGEPAMIMVARQVKENGMAGLISVDDNSGKFLALHRTAPVGTLIQVRNEANNRSIFVKVIGKLPDTGLNDKLVIKISPSAYEKLSPVDRKFRAELNYTIQEMVPATTAISASTKELKGK